MNKQNEMPRPRRRHGEVVASELLGCMLPLLAVIGVVGGGVWILVSTSRGNVLDSAEEFFDYEQVCRGQGISEAPDYSSAPPPHPIVVFEDEPYEGGLSFEQVEYREIKTDVTTLTPSSPSVVQLVACSERVDNAETITSCDYETMSLSLRSATYEVTVREARTSNEVGDVITLVAYDSSCPYGISYFEGTAPEVFSVPTDYEYAEALRRFAE